MKCIHMVIKKYKILHEKGVTVISNYIIQLYTNRDYIIKYWSAENNIEMSK